MSDDGRARALGVRRRSIFRRMLAALSVGVLLTCFFAWAPLWMFTHATIRSRIDNGEMDWPPNAPIEWPKALPDKKDDIETTFTTSRYREWAPPEGTRNEVGDVMELFLASEHRSGWPNRCFRGSDFAFISGTGILEPKARTGLSFAYWHGYWNPIPLKPLWPGLLLNTLCFGTAGAILLPLPGAAVRTLRHRIRRRRNLCEHCAYPRPAGASTCPECGRDLPIPPSFAASTPA